MKKPREPRNSRSTSYPRPGSLARACGALTVGAGAMVGVPQADATEDCTGEAPAFEAAIAAGTPEAMEKFLEKYPNCALTERVFTLLNDLAPAGGPPELSDVPRRNADPDNPSRSDSGSGYGG